VDAFDLPTKPLPIDKGEPNPVRKDAAMEPIAYYHAPWGRLLTAITGLATLLLGGIAAFGLWNAANIPPNQRVLWFVGMVAIPAAIWLGTLVFAVTGYTLCDGVIQVHRVGWKSVVALDGLERVEFEPRAMSGSIRNWGNGGMFSFTGHYRNKRLGPYRAYATDPNRSVVLHFPDERPIVLTPESPKQFAELVSYFTIESRIMPEELASA
jgi:PH (Pleckstrin Homology) domain-containing protein